MDNFPHDPTRHELNRKLLIYALQYMNDAATSIHEMLESNDLSRDNDINSHRKRHHDAEDYLRSAIVRLDNLKFMKD